MITVTLAQHLIETAHVASQADAAGAAVESHDEHRQWRCAADAVDSNGRAPRLKRCRPPLPRSRSAGSPLHSSVGSDRAPTVPWYHKRAPQYRNQVVI